MKVAVVIPTYNERENIVFLIENIFSLKIPDLELFVVDDNSPDKTYEVVSLLAEKYPVTLLKRAQKQGLGRAYVYAFHEVLRMKPDYIIHMDADLSHNPEAIKQFLEEIKNCDVVLGSRYVLGGNVENWNMKRRILSRLSNLYARLVLGVPYNDLTGGFRCFRREVLENIELDSLSSVGYSFLIETLYRVHNKNYRIHEIPITFTERKSGASKLNFGIIYESFIKVLFLRFRG